MRKKLDSVNVTIRLIFLAILLGAGYYLIGDWKLALGVFLIALAAKDI